MDFDYNYGYSYGYDPLGSNFENAVVTMLFFYLSYCAYGSAHLCSGKLYFPRGGPLYHWETDGQEISVACVYPLCPELFPR